jgi:hypothetical protein
LTAGTYTLTAVDNAADGPNGLPSVTRTLTIQGAGAQSTIIERAADAPDFRLVHVAPTGRLTLEGLTLRGGAQRSPAGLNSAFGGGILNNQGRLVLDLIRLEGNRVDGGFAFGGGIFNNAGVVIVTSSTLAANVVQALDGSGGALATGGGSVMITNSTVADNRVSASGASGGGIEDILSVPLARPDGIAVVEIVNTTIARNLAGGHAVSGGGLQVSSKGQWRITSSTIAGNAASGLAGAGGGISSGGLVSLQNTIVAQNDAANPSPSLSPDCAGGVTSLDHNLIGDPTGCTIALQPHDRTGSPGLAIYTDDGTPGHGHWPLLPTSQAIDAGDAATCPPTDQLGRPRLGTCDIGAVEFSPSPDPLAAFVTGFYRYALGREPSPTEVAGWVSFLQADPTPGRARVMTHAFFDGPEYRARPVTPESHVTALYRAILGRDPEAPGVYGWLQLLRTRLNAVPPMFLNSPEFHGLVPDCHDVDAVRALITRLYEKALGRSPSIGDINLWLFTFVTNCNIEGGVYTILSSAEYVSVPRTLAEHVTALYRALLAREPGVEEVGPWVDYLASPFIEDQFIDSPEFAARWQQLVP